MVSEEPITVDPAIIEDLEEDLDDQPIFTVSDVQSLAEPSESESNQGSTGRALNSSVVETARQYSVSASYDPPQQHISPRRNSTRRDSVISSEDWDSDDTCSLYSLDSETKHLLKDIRPGEGVRSALIQPGLRCNICGQSQKGFTALAKHLMDHAGDKPTYSENMKYRDPERIESTARKLMKYAQKRKDMSETLAKRMMGKELRVCDVCTVQCYGDEELAEHMKTHDDDNDDDCMLVDVTEAHPQQLDSEAHPQQPDSLINCHLCSASFRDRSSLMEHMQIHSALRSQCTGCDQYFPNSEQLVHHLVESRACKLLVEHTNKNTSQMSHRAVRGHCAHCNTVFASYEQFIQHLVQNPTCRDVLYGSKDKQTTRAVLCGLNDKQTANPRRIFYCGEPGCDFKSHWTSCTSRHRRKVHGVHRKRNQMMKQNWETDKIQASLYKSATDKTGSTVGSTHPATGSTVGSTHPATGSTVGSTHPATGSTVGSTHPATGSTVGSTHPLAGTSVGSIINNLIPELELQARSILNKEVDDAIRVHFSQGQNVSHDSPPIQTTLTNVMATSTSCQSSNTGTTVSDNRGISVGDNRGNSASDPQMIESDEEVINLDEDSDDSLIQIDEASTSPAISAVTSPGLIDSNSKSQERQTRYQGSKQSRECPICGQILACSGMWGLKRHILSHKKGNKVNSERRRYKCSFCALVVQGIQDFERHLELVHKIYDIDRNRITSQSAEGQEVVTPRSKDHMIKELSGRHAMRYKPSADPQHKCGDGKCASCNVCGACLATKFSLKRHMKKVHGINTFGKSKEQTSPSNQGSVVQTNKQMSTFPQTSPTVQGAFTRQDAEMVNLNIPPGNYVHIAHEPTGQVTSQASSQGTMLQVDTPLQVQALLQQASQVYIPIEAQSPGPGSIPPVYIQTESQASNPQITPQTPINIVPIDTEDPPQPEQGSRDLSKDLLSGSGQSPSHLVSGSGQTMDHLASNSGQSMGHLVCAVCQQSFSDLALFKEHQCNVSSLPNNVHQCQVCPATFTKQKQLIEHMFTHARVPEQRSKPSQGTSAQGQHASGTANRGTRPQGAPKSDAPRPHVCKVCLKTFTLPQHLMFHMTKHDKQSPIVSSQSKTKAKPVAKPQMPPPSDPNAPFRCQVVTCLRGFSTRMESVQHMFDHIEGRVNDQGCTLQPDTGNKEGSLFEQDGMSKEGCSFQPVIAGVESLASESPTPQNVKTESTSAIHIDVPSETPRQSDREIPINSTGNVTDSNREIPDTLNVNIINNNIIVSEDKSVDIPVHNAIPGQVIYEEGELNDANTNSNITERNKGRIHLTYSDMGEENSSSPTYWEDLTNRYAVTHQSRGLLCRPCDQEMTSHIELRVHIKKRHCCRFCATHYESMQAHIRETSTLCHTRYKQPESCDVCGFTSKTIHELILHKATHYDSKHISHESICFLCNLDLGSAQSLNSHISQDHKCIHCNAYAPNLDWHLIKDHPSDVQGTKPTSSTGTFPIKQPGTISKEQPGTISTELPEVIPKKAVSTNVCDICGFKVKGSGEAVLRSHRKIHFKKAPPALAVLEELKQLEKLKQEKEKRKSEADIKAEASDGVDDCIVIGEGEDEIY